MIRILNEEEAEIHLESGVSTRPIDLILGMIKKIPKFWLAKIGVKKIIKNMPRYKGKLELPTSDEIFSWIKDLCQTPHRRPGTPEGHRAEKWIANMFKQFGLKNITLDPIPIKVWNASNWNLKVDGYEIPSFFVVNTGFTNPQGITAPLAYVGKGKRKDFNKVDVSGKIVVADVSFPFIPMGLLFRFLKLIGGTYYISNPDHSFNFLKGQYLNFVRQNFIGGTTSENAPYNDVYWNAFRAGAKAICLILKNQPSSSNSHYGPYDAIMKPMPGLWIGKYDGMELREKAKKNAEATLILEGTIKDGTMHNVWGMLPGTTDEIVMVTSHHDAPFKGATEDGGGVAQVLAQAKLWANVPKEKRKRTMIFVIDAGHFYDSIGAQQFAKDHAEIMKKVKILITLEHLGAKEVKEQNKKYIETNQLAYTCMFTSPDPLTIAIVRNALEKKPSRITISIPLTLLADVPTSDAAGYVLESDVPVISWIGCPYYLLDEYDTLDKIAKSELRPICETVTELIKPYMS
ncbi:MAG: M28 family peptidase [Promethearchaeota archaeon]